MTREVFLNQAITTVIIDGEEVTDFAPGDSIKITHSGEGSDVQVGLDVAVTTFSTDRSGGLELDLLPTSRFLDTVGSLWAAQATGAARLLSGVALTSAGEPYTFSGMSIANPGDAATGGKTASARTVKFKVQKVIPPQ